jgi:hypothetical protein
VKKPSFGDKRVSRDTILFIGGLVGIFHEMVFAHSDRPTLLVLFAAMIGLPLFLRGDEARKTDDFKKEVDDK